MIIVYNSGKQNRLAKSPKERGEAMTTFEALMITMTFSIVVLGILDITKK